MRINNIWSYFNVGLLSILSILVVSSLAAILYLAHTLLQLQSLVTNGGNAVGTSLVMQDVLINLEEGRTAVRNYVITGEDRALDPYNASIQRLPVDLHIIKTKKDLALTQAEKQRLLGLVDQKMQTMQQTVAAYKSGGYEAAKAIIVQQQGDDVMAQVRNEITTASSADLRSIGPSQQQSIESVRRSTAVAIALCILVLCISAAIAWYFRRAILRERALESTKNEFLSLASHQLRTPATNVKQYLGLLLEGYMGDVSEKQRQALDVAYKNNDAEIKIMNDLLDVAKLDLDKIQLHKKVCDVVGIVRNSLKEYRGTAKDAGQTLVLEAPKQLMATVDESYIKGVLDNLLDNAIKYSKSGTKITTSIWRDQDTICISVRDQGLGIPRRDFAKLFNKFSRLDNEFSASSQGSGLGLYWVNKIVQLHRGTVDISSREGKGSVFTIRLPVR